MQRLRARVVYDFASSLCYVAHRVLERLAPELEALDVALDWEPIDLTRLTSWSRGDPVAGVRRQNALRVARELGVELRLPAHWPDARRAMAVALALAEGDDRAREAAWRERVWSGVFEQGEDPGEARVLERWAREIDVDLERAADRRRLELLELRTGLAAEAEVAGVPTLVLDGWPFAGIQEDRTMLSLLGRWAERTRERARGAD